MSTHGPRVTTRERSKRGSDAGAIRVRTRAVRSDPDCVLECPTNYGVPKSGRSRIICTRPVNSPRRVQCECYNYFRTRLVPRPLRYISGEEAPPDRVTGAQRQSRRSIFNVPQGLRARLLACPSSTQANCLYLIHSSLVTFCNEATCIAHRYGLYGHNCSVLCTWPIYPSIRKVSV